ncbi:MAG TPA: hypothetical protein VKY40_06120 [Halanaerobiales bacterium]|nr:hypothetical protein [Halanaerobiales bacterium]
MKSKNSGLKVKKISDEITLETAQYSIFYNQENSKEKAREASYQIISNLKKKDDLIIEVNSNYFNLPEKKREDYFREIIENIRYLKLNYKYRKIPFNSTSIFGMKFNRKSQTHQLISYIPHDIWLTEEFRSRLPIHGARYYITPGQVNPEKIIDEFEQMMDEEKLDFFPLIIFDAGTLSNIGINSKSISLEELKNRLTVKPGT